jgi:hypothetical protein
LISAHIDWILIVTGLITASVLPMVAMPRLMMRFLFDEEPQGPLALLMARHWGLVVGSLGLLMIRAAFVPELRVPVVIVAMVEKAVISVWLLATTLRGRGRATSVALGDLVTALIFALYLAGV